MGAYQKGSFRGVSNIYHNLITCEDKIVIPSILQIYILHWYYMYLPHQGMDRTQETILQYLYWPVIIKSVREEVTNCDILQCTKRSNIKYDKLTAK